jgi:Lysyl oxidase
VDQIDMPDQPVAATREDLISRRHTRVARVAVVVALVVGVVPGLGARTALGHDDHVAASGRPTSDAPAARAATRGPPPLLLPNLRSVRARDFSIEVRNGHRWLRFESALGNAGRGPLETRPDNRKRCPRGQQHASQVIYRDVDRSGLYKRAVDTRKRIRSAGCMVFHPQHNHWHFDAASRYSLFPADGHRAVSRHRKTSFCLRDSRRVPVPWGAARNYPSHYGACDVNNPQGIMIGWADVYQSFLPGQALRLPKRLPNGRYCVRVAVDPLNQLRESDDTDNASVRAIRIRNRSVQPIPVRACR